MAVKGRRFTLSITITNRCNLDCVYCYERDKNGAEADEETVKGIVSEYLNLDGYEEVVVDFFGGEPFAAFDKIRRISEWIWSREWKNRYLLFATTNGTLIRGEVQDWLRRNRGRFWVSLSLDGNKVSHDMNRSGSFDAIDLDFFRDCWPTQPVKMTISRETAGMLYDNVRFIHSRGFQVAGANFAEGVDWSDEGLRSVVFEQLELLARFYVDHPDVEPVPLLDMRLERCEAPRSKDKWCGSGEHMAIYDIAGNKFPCSFFTPMTFSRERLEEICGLDFGDSENFTDAACLAGCYLYPVCPTCYGANFLVNGSLRVKDRGKCDLVRMRAVFCAAIQGHRLVNGLAERLGGNDLKIRAIARINELYNR